MLALPQTGRVCPGWITVFMAAIAVALVCCGGTGSAAEARPTPAHATERKVTSVRIHLPKKATALTRRIAGILAGRIQEYSGAHAATSGEGALHVYLFLRPGIGAEGLEISNGPDGGIGITGNDERGLLYGVGKFLHTSTYSSEGFSPSSWRGVSVPGMPVRGMYLATHLHNYYEEAPIEEVKRYVEDLSLWGVNSYLFWFAADAFNGIDDPNAQAMLTRLRALMKTVKDLGLSTSLGCVANDGYANSPLELRAEKELGRNGYRADLGPRLPVFGTELCPSKPGVLELELQYCREKFSAFKDIGLDYWFIAPYDNGGCTCAKCAPYGTNGFLRMAEPEARAYRRSFPNGKVILSTWCFDRFIDGEWAGLTDKFNSRKPDWVDYIFTDSFQAEFPRYPLIHGSPGGLPLLNFPEISMHLCHPWGGFGSNPLPGRLQSRWDGTKGKLSGGFPYSEGIYEDVNKVMCAQLYWDPDKPTQQTMREYIAFNFSPGVVDDVSRAMNIMERSLARSWEGADGITRFRLTNPEGAEEAYRLIAQADSQLPARVRSSWRWRIVYLRALIDSELVRHQSRVSQKCVAAFQELIVIYHVGDSTHPFVSPPRDVPGVVNSQH